MRSHGQYATFDGRLGECRSTGCFLAHRQVNFVGLVDCFNGRVRPSDADLVAERNGWFLEIEFKWAGQDVEPGQHIRFKRMARYPAFMVAVVWITPERTPTGKMWYRVENAGEIRVYRKDGSGVTDPYGSGFQDLRKMCQEWDLHARTHLAPEPHAPRDRGIALFARRWNEWRRNGGVGMKPPAR